MAGWKFAKILEIVKFHEILMEFAQFLQIRAFQALDLV